MRSKIRLIHICIRHKCYNIINDNNFIKQRSKKIVCVRKSEYSCASESTTLKNETNNEHTCDRRQEPRENNCTVSVSPSFVSNDKKNQNVSFETNNTLQNDIFNTPVIPDNFLAGFPMWMYSCEAKCTTKTPVIIKKDENINDNKECLERTINSQTRINELNKECLERTINGETRINELNMQMLSKSLHAQVFKNVTPQEVSSPELKSVKDNLSKYGIEVNDATRLPEVNIDIPPLEGGDIEQHFYNIAKAQTASYLKIVNDTLNDIPEMPKQWLLKEGWTRYTADGAVSVDYPLEDGIVFDVEVCMKEGPLPTIATAVSTSAWYGWVAKSVLDNYGRTFEGKSFNMGMLIPMESKKTEHGEKINAFQKKPKIIVGHNVSFDRIRIKEQYWLNCTGTRFLDTMSLHICVSGVNSYQRTILNSKNGSAEKEDMAAYTSLNNLSEVHNLYCGSKLDKDPRSTFVEGSLSDIKDNFNELMTYCARDVAATHNLLQQVFPMFQERFPHPVTFAGMLELGSAYLPINSNWQKYIEDAESTFDDLNYEAKVTLAKRADAVCKLMHDDKYKEDLWMWDEDWSTQKIKMKRPPKKNLDKKIDIQENQEEISDSQKYLTDDEDEEDPLQKKFAYLEETRSLLPAKVPHMSGYPAWYRKLCPKVNDENWVSGPQNISTSMQIVPKLLNLTWENYPLHYIKEKGWGILVPHSNNPDVNTKLPFKQLLAQCPLPSTENIRDGAKDSMLYLKDNVENELHKTEFWRFIKSKKKNTSTKWDHLYKGTAIWCDVDIDDCCYFFKLPHKDGANYNVGNPLAKDFLTKFSENVLAGLDASATEVLQIARMLSYWRNNRTRIMSQLPIWFDDHCLPSGIKKSKQQIRYGAILPLVVVSGTLTRRAVEPTWMTASNAHAERVGSELRAMIQAPPGYNFVGADVDSQELWIASIIGDAYYKKIHGATPFGWMTLIGNKSNGTDMHSVTAKAVGISRDHAKIINYARIYGAGQNFAQRLLRQFNPSMEEKEAASKSRRMFALTKGKKFYRLKPEFINDDTEDRYYSVYEAYEISRLHSKSLSEMFEKSKWLGGSESAMFNRLEEIANSSNPVTPFLNSRLTRALENQSNSEKYLPTKINWVVQSGAVDFLHLMLVSMRWLMKDNARFGLSFHDEIRYLVPSRHKYNAALAMHVTNLLTRSFCASKLGMKDLPMSVAFFTSVEVDTVLRKESGHDCQTPSNPHGLENGYEIPPGESLDIYAALEKSGGSVGSWSDTKRRKTKTASQSSKEDDTNSDMSSIP